MAERDVPADAEVVRAYEAGAEAAIALAVRQLKYRAEAYEADPEGGRSPDRISEARAGAVALRGMPRPDSALYRHRAASPEAKPKPPSSAPPEDA